MKKSAFKIFSCCKVFAINKVLPNRSGLRISACKIDFGNQKLPIRPKEETFGKAKSTCESRGSQITTIATLTHYWDHFLPLIVSQIRF